MFPLFRVGCLCAALLSTGVASALDWHLPFFKGSSMQPFTAQSPLAQLDPTQNGGVLTRNINLKTFDPHRKDFVCVHEAEKVPPIEAQADAWYQRALQLTSPGLWPNKRDYPQALKLAQQAIERKHWKALIFAAGLYAKGEGVPRNPEMAVRLIEQGMQWGVPAAFDALGTFYQDGTGVKQDISRAYALWELAADLGNADAQAYLGASFIAVEDNPPDVWANIPVGKDLLECAASQGNAKGAFELAVRLEMEGRLASDVQQSRANYSRALKTMHDAVKFGSEKAASWLSASFSGGDRNVGNVKDSARAERYAVLDDALYNNPDLKFPNLDKVLPLPPVALPKWDGNKQHLVDAAKGVVFAPDAPVPHPNTSMTDPLYHISEGYTLPDEPLQTVIGHLQKASQGGFWKARVSVLADEASAIAAAQRLNSTLPRRYAVGDSLASRAVWQEGVALPDRADWQALTQEQLSGVEWRYYGKPIPLVGLERDLLAERHVAVQVVSPTLHRECNGALVCPVTGVWWAEAEEDLPFALAYQSTYGNPLLNQSYVEQGQRFPNPQDRGFAMLPEAITWHWLGQANAQGANGTSHVTVG